MTGSEGTGIVLLAGSQTAAREWVADGVLPCHVQAHGRWTVVSAASSSTLAAEPYDDGATLLASRHVPSRLSPSLGFHLVDDTAVVTAQGAGWRAVRRWALRGSGRRVIAGVDLPALRPPDLHRVLGAVSPERMTPVREVAAWMGREDLTHLEWLIDGLALLGLPGARTLEGSDPEPGELITPDPRSVSAFESVVKDVTG